MGVFSRFKAVLEADDRPMTVKTALQLINGELDEYLGGIQGEFDADTRFAITWFEQHGLAAGDWGGGVPQRPDRGMVGTDPPGGGNPRHTWRPARVAGIVGT